MGELFEQLLWGWHVLLLILAAGICYSFSSGFFQIRHLGFWFKTVFKEDKAEKGGTSKFQALTAGLAGSIGTGNIVGVAAAITVGGPGAIFWMWVSALFGMMTIFGENALSGKYRSAPGPLGYISRVYKLGKSLAIVYAAGCFLASLGMGNMIQTNAAAQALAEFGIPPAASAVIMAAVLFFVAKGGLSSAVKITEKLVPLMTLLFFVSAGMVLWVFRAKLPAAFDSIISGAFSMKAGAGGTIAMLAAARAGISRGVFTNEAGLGSSSFAYKDVKGKLPVELGCLGIFQVFVDTIVMCTITGLCIICSMEPGLEGAQLTFFAFQSALGPAGSKVISMCTALFAFATTVTWCCYGREGLFYLSKNRGRDLFALIFAAAAFFGCLAPLDRVFQIGDAFNGLMAIPNVLALFYYSGEIKTLCRLPGKNKRNRDEAAEECRPKQKALNKPQIKA